MQILFLKSLQAGAGQGLRWQHFPAICPFLPLWLEQRRWDSDESRKHPPQPRGFSMLRTLKKIPLIFSFNFKLWRTSSAPVGSRLLSKRPGNLHPQRNVGRVSAWVAQRLMALNPGAPRPLEAGVSEPLCKEGLFSLLSLKDPVFWKTACHVSLSG